MRGTIVQVSISPGGIPKRPIEQGEVTLRGISGDDWRNKKYHGGPDQALLLISMEDLRDLEREGYPVSPGALGENLTTEGLDFRAVRKGDVLRAGSVLLEITKLRQPCRTLDPFGPGIQKRLMDAAAKKGDVQSLVWGRGGFYARVIRGGVVRKGDSIEVTGHQVVEPSLYGHHES